MKHSSTEEMYTKHHEESREDHFVLLGGERGILFSERVGRGKRVLDIGCRDGSLTASFVEGNEVTGADIDRRALSHAKETLGIKTIHMDLNGDWSELGGERFDVIVAGEVVEHLFHPDQIVAKVRAHLSEGGLFIGSVPNAFSLKNRLRLFFGAKKHTPLGDPTHINHFSHRELETLLSKHFRGVEIIPIGRYAYLDQFWPGMCSFELGFVARA